MRDNPAGSAFDARSLPSGVTGERVQTGDHTLGATTAVGATVRARDEASAERVDEAAGVATGIVPPDDPSLSAIARAGRDTCP